MTSSRPTSSQGRASPSASSALPQTSSYYHHNIEQARNAQQDQRYRSTNSLYRSPSSASQRSRNQSQVNGDVENEDEQIAKGLAETVSKDSMGLTSAGYQTASASRSSFGYGASRRSEDKTNQQDEFHDANTFLPARDISGRSTGSILPSAAFFSPKRPPQTLSPSSYSPGLPLANLPSGINYPPDSHLNSTHDQTPLSGRGEPVPLDGQGKERKVVHKTSKGASLGTNSALDTDVYVISSEPNGIEGRSIRPQASGDKLLTNAEKQAAEKRKAGNQNFSKSQSSQSNLLIRRTGQKGYKLHQGANRFFLSGLIMTSDDNPLPFLASLLLMIALPVLWFVFVAPFTWHHISPAPVIIFAYIFAVALSSMCVTAWRDPGVLPRNLDPDPPCKAGEDGGYVDTSDPLAIPLPRIVRVRNGTDLKVKWCDTCGTYRPPRCSHCRVCDNCVENIDHHCTFLNTCIGRRNYFTFFAFLIASILACCISIVFCVLHIYYLTRSNQTRLPAGGFGEGKTFGQSLQATPVSAVLFFLSIAVLIPITTLFSYHIRLICLNRTTVEQIRINTTRSYSEKPSYDEETGERVNMATPSALHRWFAKILPCLDLGVAGKDPNPFAYQSMFRNVGAALLRPMTADSWIDRYRQTKVDERRPSPGNTNTLPS